MKFLRHLPLAFIALAACDTEDATSVQIDNDYAANTAFVVYKAWWKTSYLPDAVGPTAEGVRERTVPNSDYAYVVVAPGWDPTSSDPPTKLIAMKSLSPFKVSRGDILHIHVSDDTFAGNCAGPHPLSQDDADFVTQRIFPGEFPDGTYDAATCVFKPAAADAGTD